MFDFVFLHLQPRWQRRWWLGKRQQAHFYKWKWSCQWHQSLIKSLCWLDSCGNVNEYYTSEDQIMGPHLKYHAQKLTIKISEGVPLQRGGTLFRTWKQEGPLLSQIIFFNSKNHLFSYRFRVVGVLSWSWLLRSVKLNNFCIVGASGNDLPQLSCNLNEIFKKK